MKGGKEAEGGKSALYLLWREVKKGMGWKKRSSGGK